MDCRLSLRESSERGRKLKSCILAKNVGVPASPLILSRSSALASNRRQEIRFNLAVIELPCQANL